MKKMTIKGLTKEDCQNIEALLSGKSRYKFHVKYQNYTSRKYELTIGTVRDCHLQELFNNEVVKALIRTIRKLRRQCDGDSDFDDDED